MVQSLETRRQAGGTRVPPHNLHAEESLLGAMLLSRDAIAAAMEVCTTDDFYKPAHAHVFDAINSLYNVGEPADPVTVADELSRAGLLDAVGGLSALVALQADTPATTNAARYARIIEEHALLRRLISVAGEIAEMGYSLPEDVESAIDRAEAMVFDVAERRVTDSLKPLTELLFASMDRLAALFDRGDSITGVPTGYVDLDEKLYGLQPSTLVIVGARPAMGKCVAWDTKVMDPDTGARYTVEDLYRRHGPGGTGGGFRALSLGDDRRLEPTAVSDWVYDGIKPVFRVRTRLGREIRTTASHPFLTATGWRPLADLAVGARIAVPRVLRASASEQMDPAEVVLVAHLLGDSSCRGSAPRITTGSPSILAEVTEAARHLGARVTPTISGSRPAVIDFRVCRDEDHSNPLLDLLHKHGLGGCRAGEKRIPEAIFRLVPGLLVLFLSRLFATEGAAWISYSDDGLGRIAYRSVSRGLVRDVQHLLLRFGINGRIRFRAMAHQGERRPAWELELVDPEDVELFCQQIGIYTKESACARLLAQTRGPRRRGSRTASLPIEAWERVVSEEESRLGARVDVAGRRSRSHGWRPLHRSSRGGTVAVLDAPAHRSESPAWVGSDIYWDEIVAIVPDGEDRVYDLTVPGTHNFVADDMLVHNTAFALGMAAHAAMEAQVPTLVFSLEMAADEITQRLLVSEARVDAGRMRNGRLLDSDWPKISQAVARLGEAPLFIDDNPSTTIMEIRAKARRLKARHGNLGLIIVDYLQLMQGGHGNVENRQLEVSAISRGLKILARELEVPVVALSQLSRNLEQRSDKRPVLADLRESGSLEQDADVVLFLYRDEMYNAESTDRGTAEVLVAKHRNGPTGKIQLAFLDHYTRFANMARV